MNQSQIMTLGIVAAAVVVVGGGVAIAAKNAEEGDMLYGVRASLYGDVTADADVDASMDGVRAAYDEASRMEAAGTLTADERARLTATYSMHVNAVAARIAELEAEGDLDAAIRIRTDLREALREYRDVFPAVTVDAESDSSVSAGTNDSSDSSASSNTSAGASSDSSDDDASSSTSLQGSASSIFVQPSSSVTSA